MMFDIDKKSNNFNVMNILQLKWILHKQIQKNYCNKIYKKVLKIKMIMKLNIKIFINN